MAALQKGHDDWQLARDDQSRVVRDLIELQRKFDELQNLAKRDHDDLPELQRKLHELQYLVTTSKADVAAQPPRPIDQQAPVDMQPGDGTAAK